ncbi:hypothetical protein BVC80_9031g41 [Macleaya cordata]|uniref:Uncharacterized protein n=1 Tax=Macleaya cordata TaxID=56857 RepID=A0A200R8R8_MACCD|nr:hypothetical protein BVC80_9031g41 [Macleaya cordata]
MDYTKLPTQEKQPTRLPFSNKTSNYASDDDDEFYYDDEEDHYDCFISILSFAYLSVNSLVAVFKAYNHDDYQMVAFLLFLYFGFMSLFWFSRVFHSLPSNKESRKKDFFKIAIWVLTASLNLGLAIKFAPLIYPIAGVFICIMALASSVSGFYLFFIYRDDQQISDNKIKSYVSSSSVGKMKIKSPQAASPLEIV